VEGDYAQRRRGELRHGGGIVVGGFFRTAQGFALTAALAKLVVYSAWMLSHDAFLYVVIDTGIAFLVVAALHLWKWNGAMLAGVAVSIVGALVQASGFTLHEHFNHNDLYHVIQIAALVLLYRGAKRLQSS
jgi:trimethylamine:corrinoid methyltransferase-like protein